MTKIIQLAEISKAVQERFRLVGRTKFQLDETVVPVLQMGDLSDAAFALKFGGGRQGGAATEFTAVQILNPAGSGVIGLLDYFIFGVGIVGAISNAFLRVNVGALATVLAPGPRDLRLSTQNVVLQIRQDTTVAGPPGGTSETVVSPDVMNRIDGPFYISPNTDLTLHLVTANTPLVHHWSWREIPLQQFGL